MYSNDMKFSQSHEWIRVEDNNIGVVGISFHAQDLLGDIVYIELPKIGQKISAAQSVGVVESVKAASDLYTPISGEIIAINETVISDPTIVNKSPHHEGWLFKVQLNNNAELAQLMDANEYEKSL